MLCSVTKVSTTHTHTSCTVCGCYDSTLDSPGSQNGMYTVYGDSWMTVMLELPCGRYIILCGVQRAESPVRRRRH